ncbi:MAG TPA: 16S rRNA (uracil(1498)-N(3))-methyltransferase [Pyrinomonadaceae bacterium]|jgi:16S rRNA (uracil1498-N3)-methyltransferase
MTRRRFFAPSEAFDFRTKHVSLAADEARHLREVLRLKPGDRVSVFDGVGNEYSAVVEKTMRDSAVLEIGERIAPVSLESPLNLTLAVALLKGDKFDLVVQKTTELGVTAIVPVMTKFADVRLQDPTDAAKRVTRWQRISLEAAKQSGRAALPNISAPLMFSSLLARASDENPLRVMFAERDGQSISALPTNLPSQMVTILIGSEGGWAPEEIEAASKHGWKIVTLGGRILRAETAAIAITALMQHKYGDLR